MVTSSNVFVSQMKIWRLTRLMAPNFCFAHISTFYNLSFERPIPYLHNSARYIPVCFDKHASHNFKYVNLFQVTYDKNSERMYIIADKNVPCTRLSTCN